MLIGNYTVRNKSPGRFFCGGSTAGTNEGQARSACNGTARRSVHYADGARTANNLWGQPTGGYGSISWMFPYTPGYITAFREARGAARASATIIDGRPIVGTSDGLATVTGTAQLVVSGFGTSNGAATVTGTIQAAMGAAGSTEGAATASGSISALAWAVGTGTGAGSASALIFATGQLQGSITPYTELSPQTLAAEVWNASAAAYTDAGTMGFKVNSAASAGDPWSTSLPGSYAPGTAGYILGTDLQPDNIATRLLDIADAIEQELTVRKALRLVAASLAGKMSGLDGSTVTIRSAYADDKNRIVASVDEWGNRSALTYDLSD